MSETTAVPEPPQIMLVPGWKRRPDYPEMRKSTDAPFANVFERAGIYVLASICRMANEDLWIEISVSRADKKLPTWEQMCLVKHAFVGDEMEAIQLHPKKADYVNLAHCLHLWVPIEKPKEFPNLKRIVHMEPMWKDGVKT